MRAELGHDQLRRGGLRPDDRCPVNHVHDHELDHHHVEHDTRSRQPIAHR
jgi:hypothetical protein